MGKNTDLQGWIASQEALITIHMQFKTKPNKS